jgi:FdhD protein
MKPLTGATRTIDVVRVRGRQRSRGADHAAAEEPLEIRLHGRAFAVIMRTPGADRDLAAGFLLAERVIRTADDLGTIEYCTDPEVASGHASNVLNVRLADPSRVDALFAERRNILTNSSCGLCGRTTIDSLSADVEPIRVTPRLEAASLAKCAARLRAAQSVFDETGGLHAAGLFTAEAELLDVAEDVGRHNAVDKVIGRQVMRDALPLSDAVLFVSGRTSYEIVQKALYGGIGIVASVSAPSSLAIELAEAMGMTLVGFVRGDSFNIYTNPERIQE